MPLKLMYITNRQDVALIAERCGVDRVFIDMEYIGKAERQNGLDSVKNRHTVQDVRRIRSVLTRAELLVRVNPIHPAGDAYGSSREEIEEVLDAGADIVMLPYFRTVAEVQRFLALVDGRAKTMLLLETAEAADRLDAILQLEGIDEIHIGLNDLSLSRHERFMFQPLADGTVEDLCGRIRRRGIPYGFGGIASPGRGLVPAEMIIREHYRLGSTGAILSRSFCNTDRIGDPAQIGEIFSRGVRAIREVEEECAAHMRFFTDNREALRAAVETVLAGLDGGERK